MALYTCSRCGNMVDNDWHPCDIDPDDALGLMCPSCAEEVPETPKARQNGVFTADQMAFIRKMEQEDDED